MKLAQVRMKGTDTAEVLLYEPIGRSAWSDEGIGAKGFRDQLKAIKAATINLRINSPGGSVFDAAAMLAALDEHPARIEVDVDGLAASAASVIMMAGDVVRVNHNSLIMIHNPQTYAGGDAAELRRTADLLEKVQGQIVASYSRKATATPEQLQAWMDAETWFTGQEAIDCGLADEMCPAAKVAAFADLSKFGYRNAPLLANAIWEAHKRRASIAAKL